MDVHIADWIGTVIKHLVAFILVGWLVGCMPQAEDEIIQATAMLSPSPEVAETATPERTAEGKLTDAPEPTLTSTREAATEPSCLSTQEVQHITFADGISAVSYRSGMIAAGTDSGVYLYDHDTLRWSATTGDGYPTEVAFVGDEIVRVMVFNGNESYLLDLDAATGKEMSRTPAKSILSSTFSPDGAYYVTYRDHNNPRSKSIIDAATGEEVMPIGASASQVHGNYAATGEDWFEYQIAIATTEGVRISDALSGELITVLTIDQPYNKMQIGYSTDGHFLSAVLTDESDASQPPENHVVVWDVQTGATLPTSVVSGTPAALGWEMNDGAIYASNERFLFRISGGAAQAVEAIPDDIYWVKKIFITPEGWLLQTADRLAMYSPSWELLYEIVGHHHTAPSYGGLTPFSAWQMSPDGHYFVLSSISHFLIFDLVSGQLVGTPPGRVEWGPNAWSPNGKLALGTREGTLTIWQPDGETTYQMPQAVYQVAWLDEQTVVVALIDERFDYYTNPWADNSTYTITLFDLTSGTVTARFPISTNPVQILPSPDGSHLLIASGRSEFENGQLQAWSLPTGSVEWSIPMQYPESARLTWFPAADQIALLEQHENAPAQILDATNGALLDELEFPGEGYSRQWVWRNDHQLSIVRGYQPVNLVTWDTVSGEVISLPLCGVNSVEDISFTESGGRLIEYVYEANTLTVRDFVP